jgi:hypothetical protein
MGTVARSSCLPEPTCPVKPDCAIRTAARAMQTIALSFEVNSADPRFELT